MVRRFIPQGASSKLAVPRKQNHMNPQSILICTLGGSPAPVLTAIATLGPARVLFVCSCADPATGKPGSSSSVAELATQAGLAHDRYEVLEIPTDDLDAAHGQLCAAIARLRQTAPDAPLLADYTGGTKTMSAALVLAALECGIPLCLTTGPRVDHQRVTRGQDTLPLSAEGIQLRRQLHDVAQLWQHHAYAEAAALLADLPKPQDRQRLGSLQRQRDLSLAFAAWDDFDHTGAASLLNQYTSLLGKALAPYSGPLAIINKPTHRHSEPLLILDLWRNAERRAAQGRYDDAVARLYRLLEWTAQWLLKAHLDIVTADIPAALIPPHLVIEPTREGKRSAGLFMAWELLAHHRPATPAGQFFAAQRNPLRDHINRRNHSILAHGFTPIAATDWRAMAAWAETVLIPVIIAESALKAPPPQLPKQPFISAAT